MKTNIVSFIGIIFANVLLETRGTLKNEVTFKRVGELAVGATYGHLTFNVNLDCVRIGLRLSPRHLEARHPCKSQEEEVKMVWDKLEILYTLIHHHQIKA